MAEGKKSFIAYSDWNGMFKALPDDVAGKLIKHIFSYVNDEAPETDDYIIKALFEQIKATLKRDLQKWGKQREQRSEAGKKSAEVRSTKFNDRSTKFNDRSTTVNEKERNSTVSVSVSVNDSVSDNDILLEKETKEKCFDLFWNKYPVKTAKQKAKSIFDRLSDTDIDLILQTIDSFVQYKPFKEYNHPHATTYLNQKRWLDEIPTSIPNQTETTKFIPRTEAYVR